MPRIKHIEYGFTIEPKGLTRPLYKQVHGSALVQVTESNLSELYQNAPEADGAFTTASNLKLSVFTADCLPILFFTDDPKGPIGTVHCGWRGALHSIGNVFEDLWMDHHNQINAILGPCLESCCFEVKNDLIEQFQANGHNIAPYIEEKEGKTYFSLSRFVLNEQLSFISSERIYTSDLRCTFCSTPPMPSYRRNKGTDPRIRGWIYKHE